MAPKSYHDLHTYVTEAEFEAVRRAAFEQRLSISRLLKRLIADHLSRNDKRPTE